MATRKRPGKDEPGAEVAGDPDAPATVRNLAGEVVSGPPDSILGQPGSGGLIEEGNDGEMASAVLAPHLDDLVARPHTVHLTPRVRAHRPEQRLVIRDVGTFTFRRGGDKPVLEHVIKLTPPQARQLRARGWHVTERGQ